MVAAPGSLLGMTKPYWREDFLWLVVLGSDIRWLSKKGIRQLADLSAYGETVANSKLEKKNWDDKLNQ